MFGMMTYRKSDCMFILNDNILSIMPVNGDSHVIFDSELLKAPEFCGEFLEGYDEENNRTIIFKTANGRSGFSNCVLKVRILYYIVLRNEKKISQISFSGKEIDRVFNVRKCVDHIEMDDDGTSRVSTKTFAETTTDKEVFSVDGNTVESSFVINRSLHYMSSEPLMIHSYFVLKFAPTDDYDLLYKYARIAKQFFGYLCYRNNVELCDMQLQYENEKEIFESIGALYVPKWTDDLHEDSKQVLNQCISFDSTQGKIGNILQDIADNRLYVRHIPDSYRDGRKYDHPKFIMITAALEWMVKTLYPEGFKHSKKTVENNEFIKGKLIEISESDVNSDKRRICTWLISIIDSNRPSLSETICKIGKDYSDLLEPIGKQLYFLNDIENEFDYAKIGERIQTQRNNFAHGNLDKEYDNITTVDIFFLERALYALQLYHYGIGLKDALSATDSLFRIGIDFKKLKPVDSAQSVIGVGK